MNAHRFAQVSAILLGASLLAGIAVASDDKKRDLKEEEQLRKDSSKVEETHSKELEPIVKFCVEKKLKKQALELVGTIEKITPEWKKLPDLKKAAEGASDGGSDADVKDFEKKLDYAQKHYATLLMDLAKKCASRQLFTRAYDLIQAVLEANPNHEQARKILGYTRISNEWRNRYEKAQLEGGMVLWKDKSGVCQGWVAKKDVASHWEKGERPFANGWIQEKDEFDKRQMNFERAWVVESEHFEVHTQVSRAAAYEFGQLLEEYYKVFFRTFFAFFESDSQKGLELLFNVTPLKHKHVVLFFPSRAKYLNHIKAEHGNNKLALDSAGVYIPGDSKCSRASHFYAGTAEDAGEVLDTTYHEVTHQLFDETKDRGSSSSTGNNWVVEGIASYIETWGRDARGKLVLGVRKNHGRLRMAKEYLAANPDWKLSDFLAIGYDDFHKEPGRGLNYCISEAICHFLMHYDEERYKEDFVRFIAQYYAGKAKEDSLYDALVMEGVAKDKRVSVLEKQFKDYLAQLVPAEEAVEPKIKIKVTGKPPSDDDVKKGDDDSKKGNDDAKKGDDDSKKGDDAKKGDDDSKKGDDDDSKKDDKGGMNGGEKKGDD
jgi:hypothetical protein